MSGAYNEAMETNAELFIWYQASHRWQTGVSYLAAPEEVEFQANYRLVDQRRERPAVHAGIGLQEVGKGKTGAFATGSWNLAPWVGRPATGYLGIARQVPDGSKPFTGSWRPLVGVSAQISDDLMGAVQLDGRRWHGVLSAPVGDARVGLFAFAFREMGVMVGWRNR